MDQDSLKAASTPADATAHGAVHQLPGPDHPLWKNGDVFLEFRTRLNDTGEEGPVVLDWRNGSDVYVRLLDPGETFTDRLHVQPCDRVITQTPVAFTSIHLTKEVGSRDGFVVAFPITFVRREPGKVVARLVQAGEGYNRRRVQVPPGWKLEVDLHFTLAQIDERLRPEPERGYAPTTDSLWAWLLLAGRLDSDAARYVLATARRLDSAHRRHVAVEQLRREVSERGDQFAGPLLRKSTFHLVGEVEALVISLHRALGMLARADEIGAAVTLSPPVQEVLTPLTNVRNAYEHIDERALGLVRGKKHPDALTVFDWRSLFEENPRVAYAEHEVPIGEKLDTVFEAARRDLVAIADATVGGAVSRPPG